MRALASLLVLAVWTAPVWAADAPTTTKYRIQVDSQPRQAQVYVDVKDGAPWGYTPTTLRLPEGNHTIFVEMAGFRPASRKIMVTRSERLLFALERSTGNVYVDVRPGPSSDAARGAQLFIDGALVGTVPARIEVPVGKHRLEAKRAGYADYSEALDLVEGPDRQVVVDLSAAKGGLLISADQPGAEVYIDGQRRDVAPVVLSDLTEGSHQVEVRKGDQVWKQTVQVVANQQQKLMAQLAPQGVAAATQVAGAGTLRVVTTAPGAEVTVDGEPKGSANAAIGNLAPGQHVVEVKAPKCEPKTVDTTIVAGQQQVLRVTLDPAKPAVAKLRVVSSVPNAEVFLDGASVGNAPLDREDLVPGKHVVIVKAPGHNDWSRDVDLDPAVPMMLKAELTSFGSIKVLANVPSAEVLLDGQPVGLTPLELNNVTAGAHMVEVRQKGFDPAQQGFTVVGGEQRILSATLKPPPTGSASPEHRRQRHAETSFSAVTLDPGHFTADVAGGYVPFGQLRLTVGTLRHPVYNLGLDAGAEVRTTGYFTEGLARAKVQAFQSGPAALGFDFVVGGGGGPVKRTSFIFEAGVLFSLLAADIVRFTAHPYVQVYSDRNCPTNDDLKADPSLMNDEQSACKITDGLTGAIKIGQANARDRFVSARVLIQAVIEVVVNEHFNLFALVEGDPVGQRQSLTKKFSSIFPATDPQIYGRAGATFKF